MKRFLLKQNMRQDRRPTFPNVMLCLARFLQASSTFCITGFFYVLLLYIGILFFRLVKHYFYCIVIDCKVKFLGVADAHQHVFQVFVIKFTRIFPGLSGKVFYGKIYSIPL